MSNAGLCRMAAARVAITALSATLFGIISLSFPAREHPIAIPLVRASQLSADRTQLCDALDARRELNPVYRRPLSMMLQELRLINEHVGQLDQEMAHLLIRHQDAVQRLAEVPGFGIDSAQQNISEAGATAATFPSAKKLSSGVVHTLGTRRVRATGAATALVPISGSTLKK